MANAKQRNHDPWTCVLSLKDRVEQGQFKVTWRGREQNIADYFTKDLPTAAFKTMRKYIVLERGRRSVRELVDSVERQEDLRVVRKRVCSRLDLSCPHRLRQPSTNHSDRPTQLGAKAISLVTSSSFRCNSVEDRIQSKRI
jgi:hypothetical protein